MRQAAVDALAHLRHDAAQRLLGDGCGRWEWVRRLRALHLVRIPAAGPTGTSSFRNRVQATVTSAVALDKADVDAIRKEAERLTGKSVVMTAEVDASIIGGVVTKIGNVVLDGSVRTDLEMLRESLLR